jgi:hypothetical protein
VFIRNSAADRHFASTFSISSANTWETKTITIAGDTGGTWLTTTGVGLTLGVVLGAGTNRHGTANTWTASSNGPYTTSSQVDWMSNSGATFYLTGVQLEVGSTATPFERRQFGTELALCQRYYYKTATVATGIISTGAFADSTTSFSGYANFPVRLRATPTALSQSGTAGDYDVQHGNTVTVCSSVPTFSTCNPYMATVVFPVASGLTAGQGSNGRAVNTSAFLAWSAEL